MKTLAICCTLGFADYGLELAEHFTTLGLLTAEELRQARDPWFWENQRGPDGVTTRCLRLLPLSFRHRLASAAKSFAAAADEAQQRHHLVKSWLR